jgi:hypothetical protein
MSRTIAKLPMCEVSGNLFVVLNSYKKTEWYSVLLNPELSQMQMLIYSLFFSVPPGKLQDSTLTFKRPHLPICKHPPPPQKKTLKFILYI